MSEVFRNVSRVLHSIFITLYIYAYQLTRPLIKWTLHRTTGLCELQRICYCEPPGARRILGVGKDLNNHFRLNKNQILCVILNITEHSILASKNVKMKKLIEFLNRATAEKKLTENNQSVIVNNAVQAIYSIKGIRPEVHQP